MDRSYNAIIKKAKEDARTDTTRLRIDTAMKIGQSSLQGSMEMLQAQNRANTKRKDIRILKYLYPYNVKIKDKPNQPKGTHIKINR